MNDIEKTKFEIKESDLRTRQNFNKARQVARDIKRNSGSYDSKDLDKLFDDMIDNLV